MMNLLNRKMNKKGFTLIELIVVIAIIAILAAVLLPRFLGFSKAAGNKATLSDAHNIAVTIEAMVADNKAPAGTIPVADVWTYMGKTLNGTLTPSPLVIDTTDGSYSATYTKTVNSVLYTAVITDGSITVTP